MIKLVCRSTIYVVGLRDCVPSKILGKFYNILKILNEKMRPKDTTIVENREYLARITLLRQCWGTGIKTESD